MNGGLAPCAAAQTSTGFARGKPGSPGRDRPKGGAMPKMASGSRVRKSELPSTLEKSSAKAKQPTTAAKRAGRGKTYGGVDVEGNTKQELYDRARRAGIEGRSRMSKQELAEALARKE